jgi:hypothetical protein
LSQRNHANPVSSQTPTIQPHTLHSHKHNEIWHNHQAQQIRRQPIHKAQSHKKRLTEQRHSPTACTPSPTTQSTLDPTKLHKELANPKRENRQRSQPILQQYNNELQANTNHTIQAGPVPKTVATDKSGFSSPDKVQFKYNRYPRLGYFITTCG